MPKISRHGSTPEGGSVKKDRTLLQMPRTRAYFIKMPKTSTKLWRVWEGPHYGATHPSRRPDDNTCESELELTTDNTTADQREDNNRGSGEYDEQSMTINVRVSISIGKRQRPETDSSNYDGEYEDRKERGGLRDFG